MIAFLFTVIEEQMLFHVLYMSTTNDSKSRYILQPGSLLPPHYFRLTAADDVKQLGMSRIH
jgi:hypothetical protein